MQSPEPPPASEHDPPKQAITTSEQDRLTASQRKVNLIWEATQAVIAVSVTGTTLYVSATLATRNQLDTAAFLLLSNAFFLVIGFYFGRTNHARMGDDSPGSSLRR